MTLLALPQRTDVVALYVDPRGPYPELVAEWYDEKRNALTYLGTKPVIAHPPCGPWSNISHLHKSANELAFAPHALAIVQRCGGVLEHPKGSMLFDACDLPKPDASDAFGFTIEVAQCDWGHPARKRTWLYIVGLQRPIPPMPPPREPTHWASGGRTRSSRQGSPVPPGIKVCSAQQRRRTPPAFASWLVELAGRCTPQDPTVKR